MHHITIHGEVLDTQKLWKRITTKNRKRLIWLNAKDKQKKNWKLNEKFQGIFQISCVPYVKFEELEKTTVVPFQKVVVKYENEWLGENYIWWNDEKEQESLKGCMTGCT